MSAQRDQRPLHHQGTLKNVAGLRQTADRVRQQVGIGLRLVQDAVHALQDAGVDISRHVAEIGGDIALHQRAEDLPPLMVYLLHDPDAARDGDFVAHGRRLDDGPELLGARADRVFDILLKDRVEAEIVRDALAA